MDAKNEVEKERERILQEIARLYKAERAVWVELDWEEDGFDETYARMQAFREVYQLVKGGK